MRLGTWSAAVAMVAVLGGGALAGCSGKDSNVSCTIDVCTVTVDRGVDAKTSVLGVDITLVSVTDNEVTVDVGGNRLAVPTGGAQVEGGGLSFAVEKVTAKQVILKVGRA